MDLKELEKLQKALPAGTVLVLDGYKLNGEDGRHSLSGRQVVVTGVEAAGEEVLLRYQFGDPADSRELGGRELHLAAGYKLGRGKLSFERERDGTHKEALSFSLRDHVEASEADAEQPAAAGKNLEDKQVLPVQPPDNAANRK